MERDRYSRGVAVGLILLAAIISWTSSIVVLRSAAGLFLLLYPAVIVVNHIFESRLEYFEKVPLAFGLSVSAAVLGGLLLNTLGVLNAAGWTFGLLFVAIVAIALFGRARNARSRSRHPPNAWRSAHWAIFVLSIAIAYYAVTLARSGASAHQQYAFTQFWMVPDSRSTDSITIGIASKEKAEKTYEVRILADGANVSRFTHIALKPSEMWSEELAMTSELRQARKIEAWLFKSETPNVVYRKVWISAPPTTASFSRKDG